MFDATLEMLSHTHEVQLPLALAQLIEFMAM